MYQGIVTSLVLSKHPNADRLQIGRVIGHQVVVGLDTTQEELGVFLPSDGILDANFCRANGLFPVFEEGKRVGGGFFDPDNPRVRAQRFRGERSEGFWFPLSYFRKFEAYVQANRIQLPKQAWGGLSLEEFLASLKQGDLLDEKSLGVPLWQKYETRATKEAGEKNREKTKAVVKVSFPDFREHIETKQFAYCCTRIPVGATLHISEKLHGTSARYGLLNAQLVLQGWRDRLFAFVVKCFAFFGLIVKPLAFPVIGTRRVVVTRLEGLTKTSLKKSGFYKIDVWAKTFESFKNLLAEGETVYGEIVGFEESEKPIMAPHNNEKAGEGSKELIAKYGKTMLYRYGQSKGTCGFYVYRITQQRPGCTPIELTEVQYRARAKELGLFCVPHIRTIHSFDGDYEALQKLVEGLSDGPSVLDETHIKEGVVVRVEAQDGTTDWMKLKGFTFRVLEGIVKNDANYVDTEEAA